MDRSVFNLYILTPMIFCGKNLIFRIGLKKVYITNRNTLHLKIVTSAPHSRETKEQKAQHAIRCAIARVHAIHTAVGNLF